MKTIERAHTPKNLWERVKLSKNFIQAMQQIDQHLAYWPAKLVNQVKISEEFLISLQNKQRLLKLRQMLIRMRKLKTKERCHCSPSSAEFPPQSQVGDSAKETNQSGEDP